MERYEDAISAFRRSSDVVTASKTLRLKTYRKAMNAALTTIAGTTAALAPSNDALEKTFIGCARWVASYCSGLVWPGLVTLKTSFDAATSNCLALMQNQRFADHVTVEDRTSCENGSASSRKRFTQVLAHFSELSSRQAKSARQGRDFDKAPK